MKKGLGELNLSDSKVKYVRILLAGDVGAGKSCFINSVNSAFQGRITTEALADSVSVILSVFAPKTIVLNRHNGTITPVLNGTLNKSPQTDHNKKSLSC